MISATRRDDSFRVRAIQWVSAIFRTRTMLTRIADRLAERLADFQRERRIADLRREAQAAITDGHKSLAHAYWALMRQEIAARSQAQIERMERARGLR